MALSLPQAPSASYCDLRLLSPSKFQTYQAFDNDHSHTVVLKIFPLTATSSPKYHNEKTILSSLDHSNIIKMISFNDMAPNPTNVLEDLTSYLVLEHAKYGDLLHIVKAYGRMPEKLARKVFHQLIEGISHMHSQNIAHLDLKMENLLLGSNYTVKLADFDLSQVIDSAKLEGRGTSGSRAPEARKGECEDFRAADLYSAGIILFSLLAGHAPYSEVESGFGSGYDKLHKFFHANNQKFWDWHGKYTGDLNSFSEDFKKLINQLLAEGPNKRPTIEEVKASNWYQGMLLEEEVYQNEMKKYMRQ